MKEPFMLALPQPLWKLIAQTLYDGSIKLDQFQWPMIFQEEMQSDIYEQLRTTSSKLHNSAGQF